MLINTHHSNSLPSVSKGKKQFENDVIIERTENSTNGLRNSWLFMYMHIHGIMTPPSLPMPLAIPIPVVLIFVG